MQTRTVPASEYRVKGSPSINVANIVLNTSPDYGEYQQGGSVSDTTTTDRLKRRKNRERERRDLNSASHDIGDHKHAHS